MMCINNWCPGRIQLICSYMINGSINLQPCTFNPIINDVPVGDVDVWRGQRDSARKPVGGAWCWNQLVVVIICLHKQPVGLFSSCWRTLWSFTTLREHTFLGPVGVHETLPWWFYPPEWVACPALQKSILFFLAIIINSFKKFYFWLLFLILT